MHLNSSHDYWIKNCGTRFLHLSHKLLYMVDAICKCIYFQSVYRTVCRTVDGEDVRWWFLSRFICGVSQDFCVEYQSEMYKMRLFTWNICSLFDIRRLATTLPNTFSLASCCDSYTILCFFFVPFSRVFVSVYLPAWILYNERKRRPNTIAFHRGLTQLGWHDSQYRPIHATIWHNVMTIPSHSPFIYAQRSTECALVERVFVCVSARAVPCVFRSFSLPSDGVYNLRFHFGGMMVRSKKKMVAYAFDGNAFRWLPEQ